MKAHSEEIRKQVLELLRQQRSQKEISERVEVPARTIEDWAVEWRKDGTLVGYKRAGQEFTNRAKQMSNGYYKTIRKRYLGMRWTDKEAGRTFGFSNPTQAIHYYLDESGNPRPCIYCGRRPDAGKVWGLDRIDSSLGHQPGNLVPCCSSHPENPKLSCQLSKSKFSLRSWIEMALMRAYGHEVPSLLVDMRMAEILSLAKELGEKGQN
ncbi:MAG: hypothetical protein C5B59_08695 [Bacteroidetes bacterium]|nr:MAG: hypothetical protein C5B59_08695 [Bacteroidota bacterium]